MSRVLDYDQRAVPVMLARAYGHQALSVGNRRHGLDRVHKKVQHDLLQLNAIGHDLRQILGEL